MTASGICECGCGLPTNRAKTSNPKSGVKAGEFYRFRAHHHFRKGKPHDYLVDPTTGCWEWQLSKDRAGYGTLRRDNHHAAHRWYYAQTHGDIPEGLQLDHLCRNPGCVNPDHLEPVTNAENTQRGKAAKLTWDEVRQIRASPLSWAKTAEAFGVSKSCVQHIVQGNRWKESACSN